MEIKKIIIFLLVIILISAHPMQIIFAQEATSTSASINQTDTEENTTQADEVSASTTPYQIVAENDISSTTPEITQTATTTSSENIENNIATLISSSTPETDLTTASTTTATSSDVTLTGAPTVVSGNAIALANILNILNSNFINSNGVILFSNFFDYINQTLDLRLNNTGLFDGECNQNCNGNNISLNLINNSSIENLLTLQALTGQNKISGGATSTIETGNAYAGLNLVNVANTNFIDSNYLLVTLNAFKGLDGDIVFPSLTNFFNNLGTIASNIDIANDGNVNNAVNVSAQTGENTLETGTGEINSGSSNVFSNIYNQVNSNLIGGSNLAIVFRVSGDWAGEIFGAPQTLQWMRSPDGGVYIFDTGTSSLGKSVSNIEGENNLLINNKIGVIALTGENMITGAGTGLISSGNAYSGVNIVNIANSNIVGRNWIMAIINIFGNFNGNIAFGRPDLWVGEQINAPEKIYDKDILNYKFSIFNNGDSPATQVTLTDDFDQNHLEIIDSSTPYTKNSGVIAWQLPPLQPGEGAEVSYRARVKNTNGSKIEIINSVIVSSHETDNNTSDNADTATVITSSRNFSRSGDKVRSVGSVLGASTINLLNLELSRNAAFFNPKTKTEQIKQILTIRNPNSIEAKSVILRDVLRDQNGKIIKTEEWVLGNVAQNEEITATYNLRFTNDAKSGLYTLYSYIEGENIATSTAFGFISLPTDSAKVSVKNENINQKPEVLGEIFPHVNAAEELPSPSNTNKNHLAEYAFISSFLLLLVSAASILMKKIF